MQSWIQVTSRSSTLPVSLSDLKSHLSVIGTNDDTRLTLLEWSAVDFIERQLNKCLVQTTLTELCPRFPTLWNKEGMWYGYYLPLYPYPLLNTPTGLPWHWGEMQRIELARSPVQSVTTFAYYDDNDNYQTLVEGAANDYWLVNPTDRPAFVQPTQLWPIPFYRPDAVQITYVAGYTTLPGVLTAAIKLLVGAWNENREDYNNVGSQSQVPIGVQALLESIKTGGYW